MLLALQEFYSALPVALAPTLGNPLALAAYGIDPQASLPERVPTPHHNIAVTCFAVGGGCHS